MNVIRENNEKYRLIKKKSKKNKEGDRYRKRLKKIDREMEEMNMIGDNNEKDRVIMKNLNELRVVETELIVDIDMIKVKIIIMEAERKIKKIEKKEYDIDYEEQ